MKKIITLIILTFILFSCGEEKLPNNKNIKHIDKCSQGSFSVDWVLLDFWCLYKDSWWEKIRKLIYKNFDNIVIEMDSKNFLDWIENYKWDELLIHIWYNIWKENSVEILKKLWKLKLKMITIDIRDNYINSIFETQNIKSIELTEEEAKAFSKINAKFKDLMLTLWKKWIWEIKCSDKVADILWIKKEECSIIQMKDWKTK